MTKLVEYENYGALKRTLKDVCEVLEIMGSLKMKTEAFGITGGFFGLE